MTEHEHRHDLPTSGRDKSAVLGLVAGLRTTARTMTKKTQTQRYPKVKPELPARSRGVIALLEENCTACMLCARECPDWCLYIDSHKETVPPATEAGRARQRNVVDRFAIDFSLCMYCGICIEVCPFDALFWSPEFDHATGDIRNLLQEKDELESWMRTVPEPPTSTPPPRSPPRWLQPPNRPAYNAVVPPRESPPVTRHQPPRGQEGARP